MAVLISIQMQRLRSVPSKAGNIAIPTPAQKTLDAEGEVLQHALTKSFRIRNDAIKSLCSSVRRFRDASIKEEYKANYPHGRRILIQLSDLGTDPSRENSPRGSTTSPIP